MPTTHTTLVTFRFPLPEAEVEAIIADNTRRHHEVHASLSLSLETGLMEYDTTKLKAALASPKSLERHEMRMDGLRKMYRVPPDVRLREELAYWRDEEENWPDEDDAYPLLPWISAAENALRKEGVQQAFLVLREAVASDTPIPEGLDVVCGEMWEDVEVPPLPHVVGGWLS